jgi:hypothetical protein
VLARGWPERPVHGRTMKVAGIFRLEKIQVDPGFNVVMGQGKPAHPKVTRIFRLLG